MSLEAFGVKNLRCLTDTGLVPIRPITVLVGRNSSGKSTFLRAFPLLRQSVETKRNSPILWGDDESSVDFGSLQAAANDRTNERSVTFQFQIQLPAKAAGLMGILGFDLAMTLAGDEVPYVSAYEIRLKGHGIRWGFDKHGRALSCVEDGRVVDLTSALALGGHVHLLPVLVSGEPAGAMYRFVSHKIPLGLLEAMARGPLGNIVPGRLVAYSPVFLDVGDQILARFMSRVAYLAPLRVSAKRAYRIQNLAVDEVDPDGKNLPMFLRSLSAEESESFTLFTRDALGFETSVKTTGIHAEILVREVHAKRVVNLVDVGFGYSEVLPLAAILWAACIRPKMKGRVPAPLVAIEQPELHLHPAHQAKLARMFAEAAAASGGSKILVETHSESLINGLGKLIYEGVLKADDVQIVLFDKDDDTGETTVTLAGYRDNGALHDWPYGFLSPVAERRVPSAAE